MWSHFIKPKSANILGGAFNAEYTIEFTDSHLEKTPIGKLESFFASYFMKFYQSLNEQTILTIIVIDSEESWNKLIPQIQEQPGQSSKTIFCRDF